MSMGFSKFIIYEPLLIEPDYDYSNKEWGKDTSFYYRLNVSKSTTRTKHRNPDPTS